MTEGEPAAGRRVKQTTPGWEGTSVHHALYLPRDWKSGARSPVIVEYAGNGGYKNAFGDVSNGTVDGGNLGFGLSGGEGFIWVCMPFVKVTGDKKENAPTWWGDVEETKRYCRKTVAFVCEKYGGDPKKVVLAGFSRGAIGCNYIGLHDDDIAALWRAFFTFSHYDGQNTGWGYPGADRASALERLKRLKGRPQFISMEKSVEDIRKYLEGSGVKGAFTFLGIRFRNHSDQWVLRDIPERKAARDWLRNAIKD
jgi:predicted esterase